MNEKRIYINEEATPYLIRDNGTVWSEKRNRVLKGTIKRNEYHTVYLTHMGKQYNYMVHRLVAEYFIPNPHNYNIVNHINEDKLDNRVENLEWVDNQKNVLHSKRKVLGTAKHMGDYKSHSDWKEIPFLLGYEATQDGYIANPYKKIMKGSWRNGYHRVQILGDNYSVHRLVYETFKGPIEGVIDHIDGDKSNNHIDNLRDVPQTKNMLNAQTDGHKGQIAIDQYDPKTLEKIATWTSMQKAADHYGVSHPSIRSAVNRGGTSCGFLWVYSGEKPIRKTKKHPGARAVLQYDLSGNFIEEFESVSAAARSVGVTKQNISRAIQRGGTSAGFRWKYK